MTGELRTLVASLRRVGATLVTIAQTRLELLSTEFEEERARPGSSLVHGFVTIGCLSVAILLSALTFVIAWRGPQSGRRGSDSRAAARAHLHWLIAAGLAVASSPAARNWAILGWQCWRAARALLTRAEQRAPGFVS